MDDRADTLAKVLYQFPDYFYVGYDRAGRFAHVSSLLVGARLVSMY
jgi:hypothetical protein